MTDGGSLAHVSDHRREHVLVERVDCKISFATSPDSDGAEPYSGADEAVRVEVRVVLVAVLERESDAVRPGPVVVHDDVLDRLAAVTLEVERRRALQRSLRARIALVLVGPLRDALGDDQVGRVHVAPLRTARCRASRSQTGSAARSRSTVATRSRWAAATRDPTADVVTDPPFTREQTAEYVGTALTFHYVNRMVNVFCEDSPFPLPPTRASTPGCSTIR
jgi:hypothetical protein